MPDFKPKVNRLVRDRYARWLASRKLWTSQTRQLEGDEKLQALLNRLEAELLRLRTTGESEAIVEMIDLLEAVSSEIGSDPQEIALIREQMRRHWGGYEEGRFLICAKPPDRLTVALTKMAQAIGR